MPRSDGGQLNISNQNMSRNRARRYKNSVSDFYNYIVLESLSNETIKTFVAISL